MEEMIYSTKRKVEVLATGTYMGMEFYIMSLGTHPTAYIRIPRSSKFYEKDGDEIDLEVNGGITYSKYDLYISETEKVKGWFIGWDYAHYGDYTGYEKLLPKEYRIGGHRWATEEIFEEVKSAIQQIKKMEKSEK